jgi:hypothetical protein
MTVAVPKLESQGEFLDITSRSGIFFVCWERTIAPDPPSSEASVLHTKTKKKKSKNGVRTKQWKGVGGSRDARCCHFTEYVVDSLIFDVMCVRID